MDNHIEIDLETKFSKFKSIMEIGFNSNLWSVMRVRKVIRCNAVNASLPSSFGNACFGSRRSALLGDPPIRIPGSTSVGK